MRLCVVTHKLSRTDGQGRVNAEVVAAMAGRGASVDVIASEVDADLAGLPGVSWRRVVPPRRLPSALLRYQWFGVAARRAIGRLPMADIVQLNGAIVHGFRGGVNVANFVHGDWLGSPYHPARGRPTLNAAYQWTFTRLNAMWERRAFRRAERVVAVSDSVRDALVGHAGVEIAMIEVIPPGVDSAQFRPRRAGETNVLRDALGVGAETFVLMFVGDIRSNRKNLDLVLRALPRLPGDVHVAVTGDAARSPYPAMAAELGVGGRAHFLGRRTTDLPALMRGADAFAFPSHYDPFGLVTTEAMASGVVPITAPTAGSAAVIRHGVDGFVLPNANDLDAFVRTVESLRADPAGRATIAAAARATAERLSWAAMAERYEQLYREVLGHRRSA